MSDFWLKPLKEHEDYLPVVINKMVLRTGEGLPAGSLEGPHWASSHPTAFQPTLLALMGFPVWNELL